MQGAMMRIPAMRNPDQKQRGYLIDFFQQTDGVNWKFSTNWLSDQPIEQVYENFKCLHSKRILSYFQIFKTDFDILSCEHSMQWFGIKCKEGKVVELSLPDNNLTGSIPDSLSELTWIKVINVSSNKLCGDFPTAIVKSTNLEVYS